jgi:two-component system chemotaxis sensor kinase CheA
VRGSIHAKVFAVTASIAVTLVIGLTAFFSWRYAEAEHQELDERLQIYTSLAARQPLGALDALAIDDELSAIAVYDTNGKLLARRGQLGQGSVVRSSRKLLTGTIVVELSTRAIDADIAATNQATILAALVALALGLGGAWLIGRHFGNRIGDLASAAAVAIENTDNAARFDDPSTDEIGRLSGSFNTMLSKLIATQSREIELLLTHTTKGFAIVDKHGSMGAKHSAVMDRWFENPAKGTPIWSLFRRDDPKVALHLELAWESLFDGFLPTEAALENFPKRLRHDGMTFELRIVPIREDDGTLGSALVTLNDVTEALVREEADAMRNDLVALCERALMDYDGVTEFVAEGDALQRTMTIGETLSDLRRAVHTMKGIAAQVGAQGIATSCERVEHSMTEDEQGMPRPSEVAKLATRWTTLTSRLRILFENAQKPSIHVTEEDIGGLVDRIEAFDSHADLAAHARSLLLEPMQIRLDRAKDAARVLALRLGKDVEVTGSANGVRCDGALWTPFWSAFTHVVRNAIDHGIESTDLRFERRKGPMGHLGIDIEQRRDAIVLEVADDGGGVDWNAIAKKAAERGMPTDTRRDLENALFLDGFSTRSSPGEVSGRGVGLGAVRAETERLGGNLSIISVASVGTTLRFTFPLLGMCNPPEEICSAEAA